MITTVKLVNTLHPPHIITIVCVCVHVVRSFKIYSFSNFQIYSVLFITVFDSSVDRLLLVWGY